MQLRLSRKRIVSRLYCCRTSSDDFRTESRMPSARTWASEGDFSACCQVCSILSSICRSLPSSLQESKASKPNNNINNVYLFICCPFLDVLTLRRAVKARKSVVCSECKFMAFLHNWQTRNVNNGSFFIELGLLGTRFPCMKHKKHLILLLKT